MQVFISNKEIVEISEGLVRQFSDGSPPKMVDIDGIARSLGLIVVYDSLAEKEQDKIAFLSDGVRPLSVYRDGVPTKVLFPKDTVVMDRYLLRPEEEIRRRFTLAHEVGHKVIFLTDPTQQAACFDTLMDSERNYTIDDFRERLTFNETTATAIGATILMAPSVMNAALKKHHRGKPIPIYGENVFHPRTKTALRNMAIMLGVSHTALLIQLRKYDLLDHRDLAEYISKYMAGGGEA